MGQRRLSVYYFHGQDLCIVPRHVREDLAWMRDHGADGVYVGMHEADLLGSNLPMVREQVGRAGLECRLIPSRLGGLVAGWHRAPGYFAIGRPDTWARRADGSPVECFGPQVSVFHPDTPAFLAETVGRMVDELGFTGLVWDELKSLEGEDHSEWAKRALGRPAGPADRLAGTVACFGQANRLIRQRHPQLTISSFLYASCPDEQVRACAAIDRLDEFGCDGKCWRPGELATGEGGGGKVLLGNFERFRTAAAANGRRSFVLLETQLLDAPALELTLQRLPEFLAAGPDHLVFYYYPYGLAEPDRFMPPIGAALAKWRGGG